MGEEKLGRWPAVSRRAGDFVHREGEHGRRRQDLVHGCSGKAALRQSASEPSNPISSSITVTPCGQPPTLIHPEFTRGAPSFHQEPDPDPLCSNRLFRRRFVSCGIYISVPRLSQNRIKPRANYPPYRPQRTPKPLDGMASQNSPSPPFYPLPPRRLSLLPTAGLLSLIPFSRHNLNDMRIPFSVILCAILCVPALAAPTLGDRDSMALERRATKAKAASHAVAKAPAPKKAVPKKVKPAKAPAKKPATKPAKAPTAKKPAAAPAKKPATAPAKKTTKSTAAKTAKAPAKAPSKSSPAKSPAKASSPKSCALPAKKGATKSKLTGRNDDDEFCAEFTECGCKGCIENTAGVCAFNTATNTCVSLNSPGPATLISNAAECPAAPATAPPAQAPAPAANTDARVVAAAKKFFSTSVQEHIFKGPKTPTTTGRHLKSVWTNDNPKSPLIDNNAQTGLSSFNFAEGSSKIKTVFNDQDGPVKYSESDVTALCLRAYELSIEAAAKKSGALSNTAGKSSQKTLTLSPRKTAKEGGKTLLVGFVVHDPKINANICMAVNKDSCFPLGTTPVPDSTEGQECTGEGDDS
uniref:Uncharacterized protein n=1 Tax=Mycena chlorophos TaxID=658473 RepID=A0ABQ0M1M0_MYCCL|nr:predicted protein [Mycena chlorophos]